MKKFLLAFCMLANTQGGVLLVGVAEERDEQGQPNGLPDPSVPLAVEITNPESSPVLRCQDRQLH